MKRILFGLFLGLLAAELLLHLFPMTSTGSIQTVRIPETTDGRTIRFYQPAQAPLGWTHHPDHPAINHLTLIGPELPAVKQSGEIRLLILGDSVTELGGPEGYGFPAILNDILDDGTNRIRVLNAGTGGYNTIQELAWFKQYGQDCQPDAVILAFVNNDLAPAGTRIVLPDGVEFHYRQPAAIPLLVDFGHANRQVFSSLQTLALAFRVLTPWLEGNNWITPRPRFDPNRKAIHESLQYLRELCRQRNLPLMVLHIPTWPAEVHRHLHEIIRDDCRNLDINYLDAIRVLHLKEHFLAAETSTGLAWHLSRIGHRQLAETLAIELFRLKWLSPPAIRDVPDSIASGPPPASGTTEIREWKWRGQALSIQIDKQRHLSPDGWLRGGNLLTTASVTISSGWIKIAPGPVAFWRSGELKSCQLASEIHHPQGENRNIKLPAGTLLDLTPDGLPLSWRIGNRHGGIQDGQPVWFIPWIKPIPEGIHSEDILGQWPDTKEVELAAWLDRIELPGGTLQFDEPALTWLRVAGNTITAVQRPYASVGHLGTREVDVTEWWVPR